MPTDWNKVWEFSFIGIIIPLLYVIVNIPLRYVFSLVQEHDDAEENGYLEHLYLGFDLSMAAFVAVGLWLLEPPSRLLPALPFISPWMVTFKNTYGIGIASGIDFIVLLSTFALQCNFEGKAKRIKKPTKWQTFNTNFKNIFFANGLGLLAFLLTAFLIRG